MPSVKVELGTKCTHDIIEARQENLQTHCRKYHQCRNFSSLVHCLDTGLLFGGFGGALLHVGKKETNHEKQYL